MLAGPPTACGNLLYLVPTENRSRHEVYARPRAGRRIRILQKKKFLKTTAGARKVNPTDTKRRQRRPDPAMGSGAGPCLFVFVAEMCAHERALGTRACRVPHDTRPAGIMKNISPFSSSGPRDYTFQSSRSSIKVVIVCRTPTARIIVIFGLGVFPFPLGHLSSTLCGKIRSR